MHASQFLFSFPPWLGHANTGMIILDPDMEAMN